VKEYRVSIDQLLNHPLDQFEIVALYPYGSYFSLPVSFSVISNLTIILLCNVFLIRMLFSAGYEYSNFNALELFLLQVYYLVKSVIKSNTSLKRYQYFTILFFLFVFILVSNLVGLIPYSFTSTSSFVITFFLAASYFVATNTIGIVVSKWKILDILLPSGVPLLIIPFLIIIEIVSYIAKVFSLSIRLFANMMSGHALLKILIGFS
jgi:F-type H+-transporting ATPase subunit a